MSSVIELKTIKPKRLKPDRIRLEVLDELERQAKEIVSQYKLTTATWKTRVEFDYALSTKSGDLTVVVAPNGPGAEVYRYVDEGTRPHDIYPVRAKRLRFLNGYNAKTRPNVIGSTSGGSYGEEQFRLHVRHPGTEARNFSKIIEKRRRVPFQRAMLDAIKRGMEKARG